MHGADLGIDLVGDLRILTQILAGILTALTDTVTSPIAGDADCLLTAQSDMAAFADSLVAPLSIINTIITMITGRREAEIKERFERMERLWDEYEVYAKP